jgi:tRNA (guanine37-N1)-methyltransferase
MFDEVMSTSIIGRARACGALEFVAHDLRDWTHDRHRSTDDVPYGGGPGQLMKVEPVFEALDELLGETREPGETRELRKSGEPGESRKPRGELTKGELTKGELAKRPEHPQNAKVLFFTPHGQRFDQALAQALATESWLIMVCGRYEGFDERVYTRADLCISLGDYILTGGELAAMVVSDAICRLLPGVLGDASSNVDESFSQGLLEYPQYTRPASYRGLTVPEVLLNGNHAAQAAWRRKMSIINTARTRPDLLSGAVLTPAERRLAELARNPDAAAQAELATELLGQ